MSVVPPGTTERLRDLLARRLGLALDDERLEEARAAVEERAGRQRAGSVEAYLELLEGPRGREELGELATRVTVGETYFFRNQAQLAAFREVMLPDRVAAAGGRPLSILSAGCASGEEAYTLAILIAWAPAPPAASIVGIDVNPAAIARARQGRYSPWSLRQVPDELRGRELVAAGREWCIGPGPRAMVSFEVRNLVDDDPAFWRPGAFDLVFFRNVAMYMPPATFAAVIERLAGSLVPGGYLVLGDAETLRGVSTRFELRHTHEAFYYQLRGGPAVVPPRRIEPPAPLPQPDGTWVETIGRAVARIDRLGRSPGPATAAAPAQPAPDLARLTELVCQERLDDAQAALDALPDATQEAPEVLLLRAIVLTNRGAIAAARASCDRLLHLDPLNAGAHYLRALCAEHEGDLPAAIEHDRTAAHLDPAFAMPRLHLGLLARRSGSLRQAARELEHARELIAREDAGRILLFGGGFTRESLLGLCASGEAAP